MLDADLLTQIGDRHRPDRILHAAIVTLFALETPDGTAIANPETDAPATVLEVNIMRIVRLLVFARHLPALKCFVNLSSRGLCNDCGPEPTGPMPEQGWVDPPEFYGISKYAIEMITRQYSRMFGFPAFSCRLSGVYGPMDRWRPSQAYYCPRRSFCIMRWRAVG